MQDVKSIKSYYEELLEKNPNVDIIGQISCNNVRYSELSTLVSNPNDYGDTRSMLFEAQTEKILVFENSKPVSIENYKIIFTVGFYAGNDGPVPLLPQRLIKEHECIFFTNYLTNIPYFHDYGSDNGIYFPLSDRRNIKKSLAFNQFNKGSLIRLEKISKSITEDASNAKNLLEKQIKKATELKKDLDKKKDQLLEKITAITEEIESIEKSNSEYLAQNGGSIDALVEALEKLKKID